MFGLLNSSFCWRDCMSWGGSLWGDFWKSQIKSEGSEELDRLWSWLNLKSAEETLTAGWNCSPLLFWQCPGRGDGSISKSHWQYSHQCNAMGARIFSGMYAWLLSKLSWIPQKVEWSRIKCILDLKELEFSQRSLFAIAPKELYFINLERKLQAWARASKMWRQAPG